MWMERRKKIICLCIGISISILLTGFVISRRAMAVDAKIQKMQSDLSEEVFRFHVLADSDSEEAQAVKLKVRDRILEYMKNTMPGKDEIVSAKQTREWASEHLLGIEREAETVIREEGYSYGAKAEVLTCYFPDKRYGDVMFPEGYYEALRVSLGRAKGHNWWCVLYPNLCFTSATCAVVDDQGKKDLHDVLTDEEYEMVTATTDFKIKSFFFENLGENNESNNGTERKR